jgi:hypothetical protein
MRHTNLDTVPDVELLRRLSELLGQSRRAEADLIAHSAEVDARKLYAREASPSMFAWCVERLHLSEQEAYLRITVARASREHPMLLEMLRDGRLHLSGIARLVPHLTRQNRAAILKRPAGMSYRQIKELASELEPKPDAPATIRKLPDRPASLPAVGSPELWAPRVEAALNGSGAAGTAPHNDGAVAAAGLGQRLAATTSSPARRPSVEPLAPSRFKVQFTASAGFRDKLERLQALMRSSVPDGDLAKVIELAVTRELERLEARRFAKTKTPRQRLAHTDTRPKSRYIPAAVRRFVEMRDRGQCTYRDGLRRNRSCAWWLEKSPSGRNLRATERPRRVSSAL